MSGNKRTVTEGGGGGEREMKRKLEKDKTSVGKVNER